MQKTYKVAGHKFTVVAPDGDPTWAEMCNYEPFLTEDSDECVFVAEKIAELPDLPEKQLVTVYNEGQGFPKQELYDVKEGWLMAVAPEKEAPVVLYLLTDKGFTHARFVVLDCPNFSVGSVMMLMFALSTARMNTLLMHASVTMKDGKGYLFLGKSGTGKSTHSQLWINNIEGCSLLNDDNPVLRVMDDGEVRVYGSPWSGKTPCYRNLDVPVGAIVDLHQAKKNVIRRQSLPEAYASMYVSFSGCRFIKEMADGLHATNARIVGSIPFYSLECLPDADAAWLCYNTVTR